MNKPTDDNRIRECVEAGYKAAQRAMGKDTPIFQAESAWIEAVSAVLEAAGVERLRETVRQVAVALHPEGGELTTFSASLLASRVTAVVGHARALTIRVSDLEAERATDKAAIADRDKEAEKTEQELERLRLDFANACDVGRRLETRVNELLAERDEAFALLDAAWEATGVASTVRGLTTLDDVIRVQREQLDALKASGQPTATAGCSSSDNGLLGSQVIRDLVTVVLELHYDKATPGAAEAAERLRERYR